MHCNCEGALIRKGARVFLAGKMPTWMFYVVAGEVTLERAGLHGEPVVLQRTRQGFVSEASLKVARYHCDAVAITDTQVIKVPPDLWRPCWTTTRRSRDAGSICSTPKSNGFDFTARGSA